MSENEVMTGEASVPEEASSKPAPRRRASSTRRAAAASSTEAAAANNAATETAPEASAEAVAEKPKRGRTKRAAAQADNSQAANEAAASAAVQAGEASEEAPAPRRKAATRTRAKKEDPVQAADQQLAQDAEQKVSQDASQDASASSNAEEASAAESEQAHLYLEFELAEGEEARKPRRSIKTGKGSSDDQVARDRHAQGKNNNKQNNAKRNKRDRANRNREVVPSVSIEELEELKVIDLRRKAIELGVDPVGMKKADLVQATYEASMRAEGFVEVQGVLDVLADGYGFLRTQGYLPSETDCYVSLSMIRRNGLRKGDYLVGQTRPARDNEKYAAIQKITTINGKPLEECGNRVRFADLTPVYPDERLWMEHGKNTTTARVIDLAAPIGKGQRGLIVSPPKAGKTTILKDIAASISANNPEVHLMCLLVDERPEEVTDMQRSIKGEVISSTFDMPSENHIAVAELVIERAKRMVEQGADVVILLDSLTRLARAYNLAQPASGRILSGGVDSTALYPPKRFLGAARNIENGGSLTILASALVDTGSKMDEVIFEEFKGTGNMELKLDRSLADRRIFPAIDPVSSGTRKEDLLLDPQEAPLIWAVRRILANMNNTERAMDMLIKSLKQTDTNQEFLMRTAKKAQHNKGEGIVEL